MSKLVRMCILCSYCNSEIDDTLNFAAEQKSPCPAFLFRDYGTILPNRGFTARYVRRYKYIFSGCFCFLRYTVVTQQDFRDEVRFDWKLRGKGAQVFSMCLTFCD